MFDGEFGWLFYMAIGAFSAFFGSKILNKIYKKDDKKDEKK